MKRVLILLLLVVSCFTAKAQTWIGVSHSNFAGTHAIYVNPASIARSRHKIYFNTVGGSNSLTQDYGKISLPFSIKDLASGDIPSQYKDSLGNLKWDDKWVVANNGGKPINLAFNTSARLPSAMINMGSWGFAFTNRLNARVSLGNVSNTLIDLAKNGFDTTGGNNILNQNTGDNTFNFKASSYLESGITVAKDIIHTKNLKIKAGVTAKLITGLGYVNFKNDGIAFSVHNEDSLVLTKADIEYSYTDLSFIKNIATNPLGITKPSGFGLGWDAGVVVEYNPTALKSGLVTSKKNDYLFRMGVSLLNLGNVKFKQNTKYMKRSANKRIVYLPDSLARDLVPALTSGSIDKTIENLDKVFFKDFTVVDSATTVNVGLPTTISLQFDYNIFKWLYVGANLQQSFRKKDYSGLRNPSNFTIIPRFESRFIEVALPFMLTNDYKDARLGAYLRLGPVFVGTDQLASVFSKTEISGYNFYFGASAGILKRKGKRKKSIAFSDEYFRTSY